MRMNLLVRDLDKDVRLGVPEEYGRAVLDKKYTMSEFLNFVNKVSKTDFTPETTEVIDLTGKHTCRYCGSVVTGTDEDILCDECYELFGHRRFSDL